MPADSSARYYQWFMTDDPAERIVAFEWWPEGDEGIISSMTHGKLTPKTRETPDDVWSPPKEVAEMAWVVAQNFTRNQGFNVEVAVR